MESVNGQVQKRPLLALGLALIVGFFIGLVIFGWWLTPVRYVNGGPQDLSDRDLKIYVGALADAFTADGNADRVRYALCWWDADPAAATQAVTGKLQGFVQTDPGNAARYNTVLSVLTQEDCSAFRARVEGQAGTGTPAEEGGGLLSGGLMRVLGFLLVLLVLLGGLFWALSRRRQQSDSAETTPPPSGQPPAGAPTATDPPLQRIESDDPETELLGSFQTTYQRGDDTYDKSYIIETGGGDFLGECGISISEASSSDGIRNVTAFEIWLFDKNDTHTVTKVLMSQGAFGDDGYRAKLATKGDLVLAEPGRTIPLETESLIINADVADLVYLLDTPQPDMVFERLTIDLSAWVKSDSVQAAGAPMRDSDSPDNMLDFAS